jgi:hypothetical protein
LATSSLNRPTGCLAVARDGAGREGVAQTEGEEAVGHIKEDIKRDAGIPAGTANRLWQAIEGLLEENSSIPATDDDGQASELAGETNNNNPTDDYTKLLLSSRLPAERRCRCPERSARRHREVTAPRVCGVMTDGT